MARMKLLTVLASLCFLLDNVLCMNVHRMSVDEEIVLRQKIKDGTPKAATFAFAKHYQDHMVLQQAPTSANINGFAPGSSIGQQVTLQLTTPSGTKSYSAPVIQGRAAGLGEWLVTLDPQKGGTTVSIKATLQGKTLTLSDVIFGDVWICSGQSNMEFTVIQMLSAQEEIADAHSYPNIRLMTVAKKLDAKPQYDLIEIEQAWTKPDNATVGGKAWTFFSAVCWLYGKNIHIARGYPIGLIGTDWGGTPVEAWSSPEALAMCNVTESSPVVQPASYMKYVNQLPLEDRRLLIGPDDNSVLWNAMIYPFLNMTIFGAIWYQGEADASGVKMNRYNCTFPVMIANWRQNFNQASRGQTAADFPFGFVQLAANRNNSDLVSGFPDIRWHQTADVGYVPNPMMENVFMAVAMDLPDFNSSYGSIHPRDKKDVGARLALSGLAVAYGEPEMFQGPFPEGASLENDGLKLSYGDKWTLDIRGQYGFEFECTDEGSIGWWTYTTILNHTDTSVTLDWNSCPLNETVMGLRYEWRESPCDFKKCAVYETVNGLPAPPFTMKLQVQIIDGKRVFKFKRATHI